MDRLRHSVACVLTLAATVNVHAADAGTPRWDEPVRFDIPYTSLRDAAEAFTATTQSPTELGPTSCGETMVGPIRGVLAPRTVWHRLLGPTCLIPRISETGAGHVPARSPPRGRTFAERVFQIPRMPFREAIDQLSRQANVVVDYKPSSDAEAQTPVGPLTGSWRLFDAIMYLTSTTVRSGGKQPLKLSTISADNGIFVRLEPMPSEHAPDYELYCDCATTDWQLVTQQTVFSFARRFPDIGDTLDIRNTVSAPIIIERQQIEETGASTLPDLLQSLPQTAFTFAQGQQATGAQYVTGRGVGPALVTIQNRRAMASANSLSAAEFDLNSIPLAAVERVEVLPDSGSTLYGLDAIGGIVNVVLREPREGVTAEVRYGTANGGARERRITLSGSTATDATHGALIVDFFEVADLLGWERSRYANQDYRRYGGHDRRATFSVPGNFRSLDGADLPGLSAPFAGLPSAAPLDGVLAVEDLRAEQNLTSLASYQSIAPARSKLTAVGTGQLTVGETAISAEVIYAKQQTSFSLNPPVVPGLVLPVAHPQNPFPVPVQYEALLAGIPSQEYQTSSEWLRAAAAARGRLGAMDWELSVSHSREHIAAWLTNVLDPFALIQSLSASDADTTLNIVSPAVGERMPELLARRSVDRNHSIGSQVLAIGHRPIVSVRSGDVILQLGAEWRTEAGRFPIGVGVFERDMTGAFAQLRIPVVSESMRVPGLQDMSLLSGVRLDDYAGLASVARSQHGFTARPLGMVTIRGGWSQLYRAPSLSDLYSPQVTIPQLVHDSARGEAVVADVTHGGRASLRPTTALSKTFGIEFNSGGSWRTSAEYWRVAVQDRIRAVTAQLALDNERALGGRIRRSAPTAGDSALGVPGRVELIDARLDNFGALEASGIDVAVEHTRNVLGGILTSRLSTTWVDHFRFRDLPAASGSIRNRVAVASEYGTITRFRAAGAVSWETDRVRLATHLRYHPSYRDSELGEPSAGRVSARSIWDVNASMRLGEHAKLTLGALNLFDTEADYSGVSFEGYDKSQANMKGREWYGSINYSF